MSEILEVLLKLQDLEDRYQHLKGEAERLPKEIKATNEKINRAKDELEGLKNRLMNIRKDFDLHELDVKENEEKRNKLNAQLFQVKTNEEYRALQSEIDHLRREKARLEDKMIDLLEEEEEVKKEIMAGQESAKRIEDEGKTKIAQLTEAVKTNEHELKTTEAELKTNLLKLPKNIEQTYQKVKKARGSAVARLVDQTCSGCHAKITPQQYNELVKADKVHFCETCGRFLICDEKG
ncbi:MAG TPA: hypothetical protein EYP58_04520 [bacterium (Candidatus Stahlbacteria)]|nr:hypothetical protein [Candidatus Stahlbacteria bacterium]